MSSPPRSVSSTLRAALVVFLITLVAIGIAYQVRSRIYIDVGSVRDNLFVRNFDAPEGDAPQKFRWTHASSQLELVGAQLSGAWTLSLRLNGYRPDRAAQLALALNGTPLDAYELPGDWQVYTLQGRDGGNVWDGTTVLAFTSDTFVPREEIPGNADPRALGVGVDWVEWLPARGPLAFGTADHWIDLGQLPIIPPLALALSWSLAFGILYAGARFMGLPARPLNVLFGILILLLALAFAFFRPYITGWTTSFLLLTIVLALAGWALVYLVPRFAAHLSLPMDAASVTVLCAIVLLSMGLKWGGVWYPDFHSSDLTFHAHRLEFVANGNFFFTSELPDAARRVVPYPPALYVLLLPFTPWVTQYEALLLIVNVLADALAILALYFATRRALQAPLPAAQPTSAYAPRAALFAAFLFAFNPVTFLIFSWGNHTNIFGELAATLLFCLLLSTSMTRPRNFLLALFFFVLAGTAHLGIFLSLLVLFPLLIVLQLALRRGEGARESIALAALFAIGLILAGILYYGEFAAPLLAQTQQFIGDFGTTRAESGGGLTIGRFVGLGSYVVEQVGWVLLLCGIAGIPFAWRQLSAHARSTWLAWLLVGVLFALVSIGSSFSTRYTLWAAPALALSGALLLSWLSQRSRPAQYAAYALCALGFAQTLWVWADRVLYAYQ